MERAEIGVITVPPYQKVFKYQKALIKLFKEKKYDIVHSHINALSVFPLKAAKKAGIKVRIAHSHSTSNKVEWKKNLIKSMLIPFSKVYANKYMCCSELAGRYLFGDKAYDDGKVYILNNAIDMENFKFNEYTRKNVREELKVSDDTLVIGHVGRFVEQKNHIFLIDIFKNLHDKNSNSVLVLIGQGPLQDKMKEKVRSLGLVDSVRFLGQRDDIYRLYNGFDAFCFPSLYEGLGIVLIEAQANGLPCIASSEVPEVVKKTDNFKFVGLNDEVEKWSESILNSKRLNAVGNFDGYDIEEEVKKLECIYKSKKNIAIISSGFMPIPPSKGGAVENLIYEWIKNNELNYKIDFRVFSIYDEEAKKVSKNYKNTDFDFIKIPFLIKVLDLLIFNTSKYIFRKENTYTYRYLLQRLYFLKAESKSLKKNDFDSVILENHPTQYMVFKWHKNYIKYSGKYYYHAHNEMPGLYGCESVIKNTVKFLCVSEYIKKAIKEKTNIIDDNKYEILYNCVDIEKFQKKIDEKEIENLKLKYGLKDKKVIAFAGRLIKDKGVAELIKAFKLFLNNQSNKENYKLLIIGAPLYNTNIETEYEKELIMLIEDIKENVIFSGYVNYDDMPKMYRMANVVILPSIWNEPAGMTMLETIATGVPLITTNSGGIAEYVRNSGAIIVENDKNLISNLSKEINNILSNKDDLDFLKEKETKYAEFFNSKDYLDKLYEKVGWK